MVVSRSISVRVAFSHDRCGCVPREDAPDLGNEQGLSPVVMSPSAVVDTSLREKAVDRRPDDFPTVVAKPGHPARLR